MQLQGVTYPGKQSRFQATFLGLMVQRRGAPSISSSLCAKEKRLE